jgi:hypothetical protein
MANAATAEKLPAATVDLPPEKPPVVADVPPEQPVGATVERRPAARSRGVVPPVASVLPNIDFPSASSIPAINIMAAEPKLPPGDEAAATPSPPPRPSRPQ